MKHFKYEKNDSTGYLFWKLSVKWSRIIKKELDNYGLTHTQFVILANMLYIDECSQSVLSEATGIDKMTLSSTIRILERKELILRTKDINDKRKTIIKLTADGKDVIVKTLPIIEDIDTKFFTKANSELIKFNSKINHTLFDL